LALKLGRDCRLELFSDPLSQPLFTGNKVSGVDDTALKDMEFFYREMREDLQNKKSNGK
jgi:hypothetical protein